MTIVDLTTFFPYTFILHLARLLVTFNIAHTMLKNKYNSFVTFLTLVGGGFFVCWALVSLTDLFPGEFWQFLTQYVITFVMILFVCEGSVLYKLLSTVICALCYVGCNLLSSFLLMFVEKDVTATGYALELPLQSLIVASLGLFIFSFLFKIIISLLLSKFSKSESKTKSKSYLLFIFPLTHVIGLFTTNYILMNNTSTRSITSERFIYTFELIAFLIDFSLIFFVDYLEKLEAKNIENEKLVLQNALTYQQTIMFKQEKSEYRKLKHDINNILTTVGGFIEIGKPEKALEIVKSSSENLLNAGNTSYCSNETVNTILNIKKKQAEESGVNFKASVNETAAIKINDFDLCRILHNVIDNSLNAAKETEAKTCNVSIDIDTDNLLINTENSFSPKTKNEKKENNDIHGNGIKIIKDIVKKYNGSYKLTKQENICFTTTTVKNKSIDKK